MDRNSKQFTVTQHFHTKNKPFGYFVIAPNNNINIRHETASELEKNIKKGTQSGGFLNRYDLAYAGRDTLNQVGKIAPNIIEKASSEINNMAEQRINQIISQGSKEIERVLPNILRGAIEDVHQTPFLLLPNILRGAIEDVYQTPFLLLPNILRGAIEDVYQTPFLLLGKFGREQLQKLKRNVLR